MKVVQVSMHPMRDEDKVFGIYAVETLKSGVWVREERTWRASSKDKPRRIWLEQNQRLVVEAEADVEIVMDHEQNAAVPRKRDTKSDEELEKEKEKEEAELAKQDEKTRRDALKEASQRQVESQEAKRAEHSERTMRSTQSRR